ncbi:MAG: S41 family peptidase [Candidatus Brennerbacteria bacterium]|nr:S41 family peptidase [Candidatus Brennerbacteria bacterium]
MKFLKNQSIKRIAKTIGISCGGLVLAALIFYSGFQYALRQEPIIQSPAEAGINGDLGILWQTWQIAKNNYFNIAGIKDQDMIYGAADGVVKSLNDPYSVFFKPSDAKKFEEDVGGIFGGIGAEIGKRNEKLVIIAPLKDTPAERAGLKSEDYIVKIDDLFTADLSVDEAVKHIRGEKATTVILTILREGWKEPKEISIIRDFISIPTLDWKMLEGDIAYIQLYNFNENATAAFYKASVEFLTKGAKGVILDLRNNPGGFLEVAVNLGGWFLNKGQIVVKEKFSSGKEEIFRANGNSALNQIPTVILINKGSASASEILAGALRDNRNIKLIGEKSFGKGTVQELQNLKDGSAVKISIAQWLLPKGDLIEKKGLEPDIEVKISEEDVKAKRDPQLDKAIEIIKNEALRMPIFKLKAN